MANGQIKVENFGHLERQKQQGGFFFLGKSLLAASGSKWGIAVLQDTQLKDALLQDTDYSSV